MKKYIKVKNFLENILFIRYMVNFQRTEKPYTFLYLENFRAFQTVIQDLQKVCDEKLMSVPADEMPHSGSLEIRGGTPAQEMGLGKGIFLKV